MCILCFLFLFYSSSSSPDLLQQCINGVTEKSEEHLQHHDWMVYCLADQWCPATDYKKACTDPEGRGGPMFYSSEAVLYYCFDFSIKPNTRITGIKQ